MFGNFPLSGKIVAITGGASGIGLALSKLALESQASVIIADLKHSAESEQLLTESERTRFLHCDVGNWRNLEDIVTFSKKEFGAVPDVYVANAGIGDTDFWADEEDDSYKVLNINLAHTIKLTRIAIRALLAAEKKGVVAITSSIAGFNGHFSTPLYAASKHGTIGFIKSMVQAETTLGVKVVGICPGLVETPLMTSILDKLHGDNTKRPRYLSTTEVAMRMKDLIEHGEYRGGTALGVSKPGHAAIVADGSDSELEALIPSDPEYVKGLL